MSMIERPRIAHATMFAMILAPMPVQAQPPSATTPQSAAALLGPVPAPEPVIAGPPGRYPADARPPAAARGAGSPRLVPVDVGRNGNFRIAPPYRDDPAFTVNPAVPKGRVVSFVMDSADSKFYPSGLDPQGLNKRFGRAVSVYIPANYVPNSETPFIIVFDGPRKFVKSGQSVPDVVSVPTMLDNLIAQKRVPAMVAVLIMPGRPGLHRSVEYDTVSDVNTRFIESEVLPSIARDYQINFTRDPAGRAAMGESSGSAAAMALGWFHPELYSRIISYSGTFVALRNDPVFAPHGAWEFHENFIPGSPRKPLRIWLHASEFDNGYDTPIAAKRNWVTANDRMAAALKAKGYPYQYVFSEGVGHMNRPVQRQTLPEAFEWIWKGYKVR